jgi:hypothetical protein
MRAFRFVPISMSVIAFLFGNPASAAEAAKAAEGHVTLSHIFVIVLENHGRDSVIRSPSMPKVRSLAEFHGVARKYYGVTHPSLPNYIAMIAGDNFGVNDDDPGHHFPAKNLVDQLEPKHSWAAYMESAPKHSYLDDYYPSKRVPLYASKHNPFVLFDDIRNNTARLERIKPYEEFAKDMASGNVADFVFIVPNQCHDLHGGVEEFVADGDGTPCPYASRADDENDIALKRKADDFVGSAVTAIRASKAWKNSECAIFIIADESDYERADRKTEANDGWVDPDGCCDSPERPPGSVNAKWKGGVYGGGLSPAIVITTYSGPIDSSTPYNHYSLLRTIEDNWGLEHLGHAGDTAGGVLPMNDLLGR